MTKPMQLRATPPADLVVYGVWSRGQSPLCRFWQDVPAEIERTVSLEFRNRLDLTGDVNVPSDIRGLAQRFGPTVGEWSRIELRDAIDRILRRQGLPAIGKKFQAHNEKIDSACEHLLDSADVPVPTNLACWLRQLAAANLIEAWPGSPTDISKLTCLLTAPAQAHDPFDSLSRRLHERLSRSVPVGLVTDNHGEVVFDMAFLAWAAAHYAVPVYALVKSQPVETDCAAPSVRALLRPRYLGHALRVVATGSRVQGNRLDRLNPTTQNLLRRMIAKRGLLIVKGIANLDSMVGLRLDTLFLFAAKGVRTSARFDVPRESLCGLWVPAGMPPDHVQCQFVHCPVSPAP